MRLLLGLFTCSILTTSIFAQGDEFVKGYLLKGKDTLRGYIFNAKNPWNSKSFAFKKSLSSKETIKLRKEDVSQFYYEASDELFVKKIADVDKTPYETLQLQETPNTAFQRDTIFLQKLVGGELNLYFYYDFKRHFFIEKQNEVAELVLIKFLGTVGTAKKVFRQEKYKVQLNALLRDCNRPTNFYFDSDSLIKNVSTSNRCASNLTYIRKKEKPTLSLGILAGYGVTGFSFHGEAYGDGAQLISQIKGRSFNAQPSSIFGVYFDVSLKHRSSLTLNGELIYKPENEFTASNNISYAYDTRMDYTIKLATSQVNLGIKYKFLKTRLFSISAKMNMAAAFATKNENSQIQTYNSVQTKIDPLADFKKIGYGYSVGLQASYSIFIIQLRHDQLFLTASSPATAKISSGTSSLIFGVKLK